MTHEELSLATYFSLLLLATVIGQVLDPYIYLFIQRHFKVTTQRCSQPRPGQKQSAHNDGIILSDFSLNATSVFLPDSVKPSKSSNFTSCVYFYLSVTAAVRRH